MASLLHTFLELSTNLKYIPRLFLTILYRVHVMGEDLPCPPLPPYYNKEFFSFIKSATTAGHDVSKMTTKQWYGFLLELEVTMTVLPDQPPQLLACRAEEESPDTDWANVWSLSRMPCLGSDAASHAFKLLHNLLPHESCLAEILPNTQPTCWYKCHGDPVADMQHCMFTFFFYNLNSSLFTQKQYCDCTELQYC